MPNLPLYLWGEKGISKITRAVGKPITNDECTARKLRISYARVLVEVDITKPVKESVTIKDHNGKEWQQKIEYEWRPKYCQTFLKIGHDCSNKKGNGQQKPQQRVWKPTRKPNEIVLEEKKLEIITEEPIIEDTKPNNATPEENWTIISANRTDRAKKMIMFTPANDMLVQKVFTPLGIGDNPEGVPIIALLETRVKKTNASRIRQKLGNNWSYIDNYSHHHNGRIWAIWKDQEVRINMLQLEEKFIHLDVMSLDNKIHYYATIVYAMNQIDRRRILWEQIDTLGNNINLPWIVMGDYNNVLTSHDIIGGKQVNVVEYRDLADMVQRKGLFEAPTRGRLIANVQWFQTFQDANVEVLPRNVSDHSPIRVSWGHNQIRRKFMFKFLNYVTKKEGYQDMVRESWEQRVQGNAMQRLWCRMKRLQEPIKQLQKSFTDIQVQIQQARQELTEAHQNLLTNMFDCTAIEQAKRKTDKVMELNQMEENILKQKAKVNWLNLRDGNNSFFHAIVKEKNK
ncbi:uncharacterized protein LOC131597821 [Vicia villosa]|uniref:uncharacterized protein LOC131597821 n=1 Tax=Vicia villosa TaxID=3911 RepID=UPI00273B2025|nr:uncharacterized protein LOC131597821 [Vicia villosa]